MHKYHGIKSYVKYNGRQYFASGREYKLKTDARKEQKRIKEKGGKARIRKYKFGYVVYGRA